MVLIFPIGFPFIAFVKLWKLRHTINNVDSNGNKRDSAAYSPANAALSSLDNNSKPVLRAMDTPHNLLRQKSITRRFADDPALLHSCVRPLFKNVRTMYWWYVCFEETH